MARLKGIGLRQAGRLAQMAPKKRIEFLAEGFPLLLDSAHGMWKAANQLVHHPREQAVLRAHAEEEAAKILILIDLVRCPPDLLASRIGPILTWFYSHLARILYAKATDWKPMNMVDLKRYIDSERQAHVVDGPAGEYIFPNWSLYQRETQLYVDVAAFEDGEPTWTQPHNMPPIFDLVPTALSVAGALSALGALSARGIAIVADVWGRVEFREVEDHRLSAALIQTTLQALHAKKRITASATREHVQTLHSSWQMPMYNLDFKIIDVPLDSLLKEREECFWSEFGGS